MKSEDPGKEIRAPEAEGVYTDFLKRKERGEDVDFEALCRDRPEMAQALRILQSLHMGSPPEGEGVDRTSVLQGSTDTAPLLSAPSPGQVGPYRLLEVLGEGGMGTVYLAEQETPVRRRVALKLIKLGMDTKEVVARFEAERQAMALLDHPNISKIYDAGATADGRPYFAMEYIRGVPLIEYCDRDRLSLRERLEVFVQICQGAQHAHQRGIIHRDLKPSNVLVSCPDQKPLAKIIDFGVAKAIDRRLTEKTIYTGLGRTIGTPAYMSPEQAETTAEDLDHRADVYSLGAILYELLVGEPPLDWESLDKAALEEVLRRIREEDPPPPSVRWTRLSRERTTWLAERRRSKGTLLAGELRGDLDWIALKALEKDRRRRYAAAADLAADIERHLRSEPVLAGPPSVLYRLGKFVRKNRGPMAAAAAIFAILLAGAVTSLILWGRAEDSARSALKSKGEAQKSAGEAEERRKEAVALAAEARKALAEVRWKANVASLAVATLAVERGDFEEAGIHLEACPAEERGWEWHHLDLRSRAPSIPLETWWREQRPGAKARKVSHKVRLESGGFSPDGLRIARCSESGEVAVWDALTGKREDARWDGGPVRCLSFSPDGKRIAASSDVGEKIIIADARTLKRIAAIEGEKSLKVRIRCLAFDPGGARIASGSTDGGVKAWDIPEGKPSEVLWRHEKFLSSLAFSADGRALASGGDGGSILVRDSRYGTPIAALEASSDTGEFRHVTCLRFSPDGGFLFSGAADGTAVIWSTANWTRRTTMDHGEAVQAIARTASGKIVVASEVAISVWTDRGERLSAMRGGFGIGAILSPDGLRCANDQRMWKLDFVDSIDLTYRDPRWRSGIRGIRSDTRRVALKDSAILSPDGSLIAEPKGKTVNIMVETGWNVGILKGHAGGVLCLSFDSTGRRLASGDDGGGIRIWDTEKLTLLGTIKGHEKRVLDLDFDHDGGRLASASADGTVRLWDARDGRQLKVLEGHEGPAWPQAVAFGPAGKLLASGDTLGGLVVWEAEAGAVRARMKAPPATIGSLCFTPDGRRLASLAIGEVRIWDSRTGDLLLALRGNPRSLGSRIVTFGSDGKDLLAETGDRLAVWRTSPRAEDGPVSPQGEGVASMEPAFGHLQAIERLTAAIAGGKPGPSGLASGLESAEGPSRHLSLFLSDLPPPLAAQLMKRAEETLESRFPGEAREFAQGIRSWVNYLSAVKGMTATNLSMREVGFRPGCSEIYGIRDRDQKEPGGIYFCQDHGKWDYLPLVMMESEELYLFDPGGALLATSSHGRIAVWDLHTRKRLHEGDTPARKARHFVFSHDGRRLAAGFDDGMACVWDARSGERLALIQSHEGPGDVHVSISPGGDRLCTWIEDGLKDLSPERVRFWDVADVAEAQVLPQPPTLAGFSPDGLWIVSVPAERKEVHISSAKDGRLAHVLRGHEGSVREIRFSPDGRSLLTSADDGTVRLWNLQEGSLRIALRLPGKAARAGFGPLGKHVFTECRSDGKRVSQLWDSATGREILRTGCLLSGDCLSLDERSLVLAPRGLWVLLDVAALGGVFPDVPAVLASAEENPVPTRLRNQDADAIEEIAKALVKSSDPAANKIVRDLGIDGRTPSPPEEKVEDLEAGELIARLKDDPQGRQALLQRLRAAVCHPGHPPEPTDRPDLIPVAEAALEMVAETTCDGKACTASILLLAYMAHREAAPALLKAAHHRHFDVRFYAVMGLRFIGREKDLRERIVAELRRIRDDPGEHSFDVQLSAAHSLVELGEEEDPAIFLDALRGKSRNASLAASSLAMQGRKEAIALIIESLAASRQGMSASCAESLRKMTGADLGPNIAKWKAWLEEHRAELPEQIR